MMVPRRGLRRLRGRRPPGRGALLLLGLVASADPIATAVTPTTTDKAPANAAVIPTTSDKAAAAAAA